MHKKTLKDIDISSKRLLIRVDFNVPLHPDGSIADDTRILACLPTIRYACDMNCRIILCSHLGRPHGRVVEDLRLGPVARRLSELLGVPVTALPDTIGPEIKARTDAMNPGEIILLENLRFYPGEEKNDPVFSSSLAELADIYVNDAFGASHRAHASIVGVAHILPAVAGLLMDKELTMLGNLLEDPKRPFAAVLGGSKVTGKLQLVEYIITKVNLICIGGGMAATCLTSQGYTTGNSLVEEDTLDYIGKLFRKAESLGVTILVPSDVVITCGDGMEKQMRSVPVTEIPDGWSIVDIGSNTLDLFLQQITPCKTIFWNGPMGKFEDSSFAQGTKTLAEFLARHPGTTIIGGGSTAEAVTELGLANSFSHVSTGGGASLQFLTGTVLPGVEVLWDKDTNG